MCNFTITEFDPSTTLTDLRTATPFIWEMLLFGVTGCDVLPTTYFDWETAIVRGTSYPAAQVMTVGVSASTTMHQRWTFPALIVTLLKPGDTISMSYTVSPNFYNMESTGIRTMTVPVWASTRDLSSATHGPTADTTSLVLGMPTLSTAPTLATSQLQQLPVGTITGIIVGVIIGVLGIVAIVAALFYRLGIRKYQGTLRTTTANRLAGDAAVTLAAPSIEYGTQQISYVQSEEGSRMMKYPRDKILPYSAGLSKD